MSKHETHLGRNLLRHLPCPSPALWQETPTQRLSQSSDGIGAHAGTGLQAAGSGHELGTPQGGRGHSQPMQSPSPVVLVQDKGADDLGQKKSKLLELQKLNPYLYLQSTLLLRGTGHFPTWGTTAAEDRTTPGKPWVNLSVRECWHTWGTTAAEERTGQILGNLGYTSLRVLAYLGNTGTQSCRSRSTATRKGSRPLAPMSAQLFDLPSKQQGTLKDAVQK